MKYSLTNQLAILFNWTGQGGKKAFGSSRLLSVIRWTFTFKCGAIRIKKYDNLFLNMGGLSTFIGF
jgi:hypothetical protein